MLRILAILFGVFFVIAGILGFIPDFTPQGKLLGIFAINPLHNIIHIATGILALLSGLSSSSASKFFFIFFGLAYAVVAGFGFYYGEGILFNTMPLNIADNLLNAGIAIVSLYIGFAFSSK